MAFEPRIVRPDEFARPDEFVSEGRAADTHASSDRDSCGPSRLEADDVWLPDDLQELASQLSVDAARLADCHPCVPIDADGGRANARHWLPRVAAAAVLLGIGLWVAGREERPEARPSGPLSSMADTSTAAASDQDRLAGREPAPESDDRSLIRAVMSPAVSLDNLTAPEREGVLDLLEQQAAEPASVSI